MSLFNIIVDSQTMRFPSQVSPFIFKDCKELVQKMIDEANSVTEPDRKIINSYTSTIRSGGYVCCIIASSMTVIGLPFLCCYFNKIHKSYQKATERILKTWEEISNKYNEKLVEKGAFARFVSISSVVRSQDNVYNEQKYFYEFTFKDNFNQNQMVISNVNNMQNLPPPEIQKLITKNSQ
jgi:hypothetical protein